MLGVVAASMVFLLTRGALLHFVGLAESRSPRATIEVIPPGLNESGGFVKVYLRNLGPDALPVVGPDAWTVVIDGTIYSVLRLEDSNEVALADDDLIGVGDIFLVVLSSSVDLTEPHDVAVYGPYSTRARAGYSP